MHFFCIFSSKNLEVSKICCTFALEFGKLIYQIKPQTTKNRDNGSVRILHFLLICLLYFAFGATLYEMDCKDTKSKSIFQIILKNNTKKNNIMAKNSIPTTEPKFYFKDEKAYLSKPITERLEKLGLVMDEYVSNEYFHSFDTHQVPVCVAKQFLFDRFNIFISTRVHRYVDCLTTERYHCFHGVVDDLSLSVRSERILGNDFDTEYEAYKDAIEFSLFLLEEKSKTTY